MGEYRAPNLQEINLYVQQEEAAINEQFLAHCRRYAEYLLPQFSDLAGTTNLITRFKAVWLLVHLSPEEGFNRVVSYIKDATDFILNAPSSKPDEIKTIKKFRQRIIHAIPHIQISLSDDMAQSLHEELMPLLNECHTVEAFYCTIHALLRADRPQLGNEMQQFLDNSAGLQKGYYAIALMKHDKSAYALNAATELLTEAEGPFAITPPTINEACWKLLKSYLKISATRTDPLIAHMLLDFIRLNASGRGYTDNDKIAFILQHIPAKFFEEHQYQDLLDHVLNSRLSKEVKSIAISKVAEGSPKKGCGIMFSILLDNARDMDAAQMLSMTAKTLKEKQAGDELEDIKGWLYRNIEQDPSLITLMHKGKFPYWDAFMEVVEPGEVDVRTYTPLLDPVDRMRLHCFVHNVEPSDIASSLNACGVITDFLGAKARIFSQEWKKGDKQYQALCDFIQKWGRYTQIRLEEREPYPDYRLLLAELEKISDSYFKVMDFKQSWQDGDDNSEPEYYTIEMTFNDKPCTMQVPANNGILNVQPFISKLNQFLNQIDVKERFFHLYRRGAEEGFIWAKAGEFQDFCKLVSLPVLADKKHISHKTYPPLLNPLMNDGYSCGYLKLESIA